MQDNIESLKQTLGLDWKEDLSNTRTAYVIVTPHFNRTVGKLIDKKCYSAWTWANCDDYYCPKINSDEWFESMFCPEQGIGLEIKN